MFLMGCWLGNLDSQPEGKQAYVVMSRTAFSAGTCITSVPWVRADVNGHHCCTRCAMLLLMKSIWK